MFAAHALVWCAQEMVRAAGIFAPVVGHVGDGNFHMLMVIDTNNRYEV